MSEMDLARAIEIVGAYRALVDCALKIASDVPYAASVDEPKTAHIDFDGDEAVLSWTEYDSDYYGGGHLEHYEHRFPAEIMFISDEVLAAIRHRVKTEEAEKHAKLRAAQAAVERERTEARDRAEYDRLLAKYGR